MIFFCFFVFLIFFFLGDFFFSFPKFSKMSNFQKYPNCQILFFSWFLGITAPAQSRATVLSCIRTCFLWEKERKQLSISVRPKNGAFSPIIQQSHQPPKGTNLMIARRPNEEYCCRKSQKCRSRWRRSAPTSSNRWWCNSSSKAASKSAVEERRIGARRLRK